MIAPGFWARPPASPGWQARVLAPLAWLWTWETRRRLARAPSARLAVPVICVGNLTTGGTGKTPAVIALVEHLRARGFAAHVVSRGHGGSLQGPVRVDPRRHSAAEVGDEPILLAAFAPVWVARDRAAAGQAAAAAGAEAVVMDDGFQNPCLAKDISIVVVDAGFGFGNGRVVPARPLREPVPDGLARADLLLAIGHDPARLLADWPDLATRPMLAGEIAPLATGMTWSGLRALAFAGIGRPEKFYATLRGLGVELAGTRSFADHAPYGAPLLARLEAEARGKRAQLVTTEKDAVRLPAAMRAKVLVLPVRLEIDDWTPLDDALAATTAEPLPKILPVSNGRPPAAPDMVSAPRATGESPNKS
jgi:tetraacyldisaccharide 4'-kinase